MGLLASQSAVPGKSSCLKSYLNAARPIFETSFIILQVQYIVGSLTLSNVSALITSPDGNIKCKCTYSFGDKMIQLT